MYRMALGSKFSRKLSSKSCVYCTCKILSRYLQGRRTCFAKGGGDTSPMHVALVIHWSAMETRQTVLSVGLLRVMISPPVLSSRASLSLLTLQVLLGTVTVLVGQERHCCGLDIPAYSDMALKWANEFEVPSNALEGMLAAFKNTACLSYVLMLVHIHSVLTVCQEYDKHFKSHWSPLRWCYYYSHVTHKKVNSYRGHIICLRWSS